MKTLQTGVFNGITHSRFKFCAGWTHAHPPSYCAMHAHREFEIVYHLRGHGRQTVRETKRKRVIEFAEESVVICPPGVEHDQMDTGAPIIDVCVSFALAKPWPAALTSFVYVSALPGVCEREEILDLVSQTSALSPQRHVANGYRVGALVVRLLEMAHTESTNQAITFPATRYAVNARDYLRAHFTHLEKLEDVARQVGISYDYLRHIFKATCGVSLIGYLNELRINRAKELLAHSRLPIKTIGGMCGFGDERYFATCFRKRARVTPGRYRRLSA